MSRTFGGASCSPIPFLPLGVSPSLLSRGAALSCEPSPLPRLGRGCRGNPLPVLSELFVTESLMGLGERWELPGHRGEQISSVPGVDKGGRAGG